MSGNVKENIRNDRKRHWLGKLEDGRWVTNPELKLDKRRNKITDKKYKEKKL